MVKTSSGWIHHAIHQPSSKSIKSYKSRQFFSTIIGNPQDMPTIPPFRLVKSVQTQSAMTFSLAVSMSKHCTLAISTEVLLGTTSGRNHPRQHPLFFLPRKMLNFCEFSDQLAVTIWWHRSNFWSGWWWHMQIASIVSKHSVKPQKTCTNVSFNKWSYFLTHPWFILGFSLEQKPSSDFGVAPWRHGKLWSGTKGSTRLASLQSWIHHAFNTKAWSNWGWLTCQETSVYIYISIHIYIYVYIYMYMYMYKYDIDVDVDKAWYTHRIDVILAHKIRSLQLRQLPPQALPRPPEADQPQRYHLEREMIWFWEHPIFFKHVGVRIQGSH